MNKDYIEETASRAIGFYLNEMAKALDDYNNAIMENMSEKE